MAITTDSVMADTVPTVLENARFTEQFSAIMSGLVWKIRKKLHDGKNVNVPIFGTITARALTEGVDNTVSETMSDSLVTITPAEVGAKLILTDKLVRDDSEDIKAAAGRLLGAAMELKRDQDLLALFSTAATTLGTSDVATLGQIAAAWAIIKGNPVSNGGPGPGSLAYVQHPYVLLDLVDVFTPLVASASIQAVSDSINEVVRTYGLGKLFGMPVIQDGNIDTTTVANSALGGVFCTGEGGAIILATAAEWGIEPERDASLRATELNIVGEYGVGWYDTNWGVLMTNDAATPA